VAKGQRPRRPFTVEERRVILRLAVSGASLREIGAAVDRGRSSIQLVLSPAGGVHRREVWQERPRRGLSIEQRIEIALGLGQGLSFADIGERIGRHRCSVWREVRGNGGRERYRPMVAHRRAGELALRPKVTKLAASPALVARVIVDLQQWWSPQQITRRLRRDFGEDESMQLSHETIYQSLFVQGRGELRRELTRCLRTGRAARRPRARAGHTPDRILDKIMISDRAAEAADRAVPGHWEGDLILGAGNRSAIGTLVERSTRFVMLLHLGAGKSADAVRDAMLAKIAGLPEQLRRSLTWDQGVEMARHREITLATGLQIYFCDPHSPWQRGSNENTNGLLRQYFPKGTDLSVHTEADLDTAAASLNGRPRMTLNWDTPTERMTTLLSH
jgi:transposase, IS30 family